MTQLILPKHVILFNVDDKKNCSKMLVISCVGSIPRSAQLIRVYW